MVNVVSEAAQREGQNGESNSTSYFSKYRPMISSMQKPITATVTVTFALRRGYVYSRQSLCIYIGWAGATTLLHVYFNAHT